MLVQVSDESNIARISSYGFAFGYLGGGLLFLVNAAMTIKPEFFGLSSVADAVRWSFLSVSVWWTLFLIPILLKIQDRGVNLPGSHFKLAYTKVFNTLPCNFFSFNTRIFRFRY